MNKIVAVDLDGIILEKWDGEFEDGKFGDVKKNARWGLHKLKEMGYDIVIWTCRGCLTKVKEFLDEERIPYDNINYHPAGFLKAQTSRKIYADVYIDDRALGCPQDWDEIIALMTVWDNERDQI